jgi:amino acid carrier family protein
VYLDAFSGEIKSSLVPHDSGFIGVITELHENLLLEKSGQILLGLTAIFAFIISISGFIVRRNFWANLLRLRFSRMATFMSDSHKFIGVFSTPVIFAVALSGAWWELRFVFMPPFDNSKFAIGPEIYDKNISIDALVQKAASDMPGFETHYVSFPFYDGANITLYGQKPQQSFLHSQYSSTVSYDKNSANLIDVKYIELASKTDKFLSTFRRAHYGDYNAATKFIWFLCGLAPLALSISGIYLWIKRSNFKRRKR